jgi:glycosyltransferase involved in cell wall biosynthesis
MSADAPRLLFVVTEDWYFVSHRLQLAIAAQRAGYRVAVATRVQDHAEPIANAGIELVELKRWRRSSLNPLREFLAVAELTVVMRRWRPNIVHLVALKPVLYGGLAARLAGVAIRVNALAGLGFVFLQDRALARLLRPLVKLALRWSLGGERAVTIVQNPDDRDLLVRERLVDVAHVRLIRGSGVDLDRFRATELPVGRPVVLLMSRMLWDKGVAEFVEAARIARESGADARFVLVGDPDPENPAAIPREVLQRWNQSSVVEWWGQRSDAPAVLAQARIVVLPSYREGLPKVLLEAAASGRPMIATDVPGCREIVEPGVTGVLVPPRDASGLAHAILALLDDPERCRQMGARARDLAEREFGIEAVVSRTLDVYRECLGR